MKLKFTLGDHSVEGEIIDEINPILLKEMFDVMYYEILAQLNINPILTNKEKIK